VILSPSSFRASGFSSSVIPGERFLFFRHSGRAKRDPESRNHADQCRRGESILDSGSALRAVRNDSWGIIPAKRAVSLLPSFRASGFSYLVIPGERSETRNPETTPINAAVAKVSWIPDRRSAPSGMTVGASFRPSKRVLISRHSGRAGSLIPSFRASGFFSSVIPGE